MALKYYAYFNSTAWAGVTSTRYKIEIYDTTFSGTATEVTTGANPFSEKELNNEETTYGIKGCRFDIDIVSDVVTVEDFYTQEGMSHRVKLYEAPLVGDMALIRDGYLLSEDVQEVYQDGIKVIQLSGTDGLELLKTIPFEFSADKPYTGVMTALLLLDRCVTPIGLELNVNTSFNYYQDGQSKIASFEPLAFFNVHAPLFKGKTCYEALNMLCETLRCVIFQEDGEWWFIHTLNPDSTTQYYRKWDSDFNSLSNGTLPSAITVEFEGEYAPFNGNKLKKRSYKKSVTEVDLQGYVNKLKNPDFQSGFTDWNNTTRFSTFYPVPSYSFGGLGTNKDPYYIQLNGYNAFLNGSSSRVTGAIWQNIFDTTVGESVSISEVLSRGVKVSGKVIGNDVRECHVVPVMQVEFGTSSVGWLHFQFVMNSSGKWTPITFGNVNASGDWVGDVTTIKLTDQAGLTKEEYTSFSVESEAISEVIISNKNFFTRIFENKLYKLEISNATRIVIDLFITGANGNAKDTSSSQYGKYVRWGELNVEITDKSRVVGLKKNRYLSEQSTHAPNELKIESHFADYYDAEQLITILQSDEITPTVLWEDINGNNTGELLTSLNRELLSLYYKPTSLYDGDILGRIKKYHKINLNEFSNELINMNWNFDFGQGIASGVRYIMTFANYGTFTNSKLGVYNDDKEIPYDDVYPTGSYEFDLVENNNSLSIYKQIKELNSEMIVSDSYMSFSKIDNESGINWYDSITGDKTDYFLTTEDGFVFKSETNPYEVTLDFTELTANTKLIIPPLSADAYLLTSENGWVLEGNNISTAKKLGSTTAQDWTIIHTNNTIATVNSSGINLGENLLTAGGVQFDLTPTQTGAVGKLMWNDTDGTLEFGMKGGNVTQQIGQELPVLVKHADNTGLANGAVVYVVGSDGSNKTVRYALANAESTSSKTFGVMTEDASGGSKAFCTTFGIVRNIDTSALTEGAAVYLSPTVAGGMTTTKPSAPNHMVLVGFCIRSHATLGSIFVKIINGFELNEIHDVAIGTLANNNLLAYESATSLWKNKTYSELGLFPTPSGLTTNYIPKWNGTALANSQLFDSGTFVGIGTATPATLLDVRGQISASLGSASAPAFSFVGDLNTGVYSPSADTVSIATGGSERLRIDSIGRIGFGTTSFATSNLRINRALTGGGAFMYSINNDTQVRSDVTSLATYYRTSAGTQATSFTLNNLLHFQASQGTIGAGSSVTTQTAFFADNTIIGGFINYGFRGAIPSGSNRWNAFMDGTAQNHFRGNVGIGLSSTVPATELEVRGVISASLGSASLPSHTFVGDLNNGWWSPAADTQAWSLSGAEVMRLNSTGLGIGVTPSYKLDVSGTGHFTGAVTFDTVPSSLQDATSANHLVRYSQWISSTTVKYLPTAVKTVSLTNITLSGTQTVNGVALVATDRILVAGQTSGADNGVWVVAAGAWSRATDSDTDDELRGYIINISGGTYAGYKYINTNGSTIAVGTTAITYSEFSNVSEIDPVFVSWRDTSRTANTFWAAPNGSNGAGTWRAIVAADIPTLNQNTTGSAATLTTSRNIAISGDLTWNVDFNGSAAVTAVGTLATVNSNIGTFAGITVNEKGLVTAATALTTLSGYGITDFYSQIVSGFVTGANSSVLNTDTLEVALEKLQGQINARISGNQTITLSGIVTGSGTTAITTAIADSALSIAKTSGLQTALDGKFANPSGLTTNYVSKWNGTGFSNSLFFDTGTSVGIGTTSPTSLFSVQSSSQPTITLKTTATTGGQQRTFFDQRDGNDSGWRMLYVGDGSGSPLSFSPITSGTVGSVVFSINNSGAVGIGTTSLTGINFSVSKNLTGALNSFSIQNNPQIQSDVTGSVQIFRSVPSTQANSFTIGGLRHYEAAQGTIGAGSSITSQIGYSVDSSLIGADNNYGFYGNIPSGSNRWNVYMIGTAQNYFRGSLGIGVGRTVPAYELDVAGTIRATTLMITSGATNGSFLKSNNVNGTSVWASITISDISNLSSWTGSTSITTLGTIATGTWGGTAIGITKGGTGLTALGTANQLLRVNSVATALEYFTPTYISANQTITLSGDVSGSGTTSITTTLATITQASSGDFKKITLDTKGRVTGNTAVVIGDLTALGAITLTSLSSTATGLTYTNTTGVFSLTSGYSIPTTANQTNWSTAYGWGNHASAGYLTTSTAASTYQPILPSGTAGQFLIRNASNALEFSTLELEPVGLSNNKIAVGDSANYLSEYNNFEFLESRFISIYRPSDSSRALYMGMDSLSNNSFITAAGGHLTLKGDTGIYLHGFTGFGNKMVIVDGDGKLGYTDIPSGGSGSSSLTSTYIGYGSSVNTLTGNSTFTYLDNRYIHLTSSGSDFNLGTFSSAGFIESVNGNLLLQARSTYGVVVDEGYFQVDALGGGGTKMVVVDNNGKFNTQTIPSGGGVPALTATQIGFGDGSNLMTSSSNFTYNGSSIHFKNGTTSELVISYGGVSGGDYDFDCPSLYLNLTDSFNVFCDNFTINNGGIGTILGTEIKIGNTGSNTKVEIGFGGTAYTGNEIKLSGTSFKLSLGDGFGGAYTPSNGDKCTLTYDGSKGAFVLQKMNTYNDGTRTFLIL